MPSDDHAAASSPASPENATAETTSEHAPTSSSSPTGELLRRLAAEAPRGTRYKIEEEIARGGMGAILRVRDSDIGRDLAMKVALGGADPRAPESLSDSEGRNLARFLEEAQITGQLDHPGVVPVHELGVDLEGRLYFTMKLVRGRELKQVLELVREEKEGWNRTRALGVVLKVCEAVAYAHSKGVIHRDLKPANVMVGEYGEVYVMDWGLARAVGRKDTHDLRLRADQAGNRSIRTERRREKEESADSPLVTMDGDVVGTPCYMALEQAQGRIADLGPRSDVYSVGAMLYELLAGEMPYVPRGAKLSNRTVLTLVLQGPPRPIAEFDRSLPPELVAICEKAMRRDAAQRYPDTLAMAEDLRAFLEGRVVAAFESGAIAELRKWVARNRALASVSAAALLLALIGLAGVLYVQSRRRAEAEQKNVELARARETAEQNEKRAEDNAVLARRKADDVLSLSAVQDLQDLEQAADDLWPAVPSRVEAYERWLERASALTAGLDGHRARLTEIRSRAASSGPAPEPTSAGTPAEKGFAGLWSTNFGNLKLHCEGDRAVGVYMSQQSRTCNVDGLIDGARFEFTFEEPRASGVGWLILAADGESIAGQRKGERSANWESWTGKRIADAPAGDPTNLGFEDGSAADGFPTGWNGTRAKLLSGDPPCSIAVDTQAAHSGRASARIAMAEVAATELFGGYLNQFVAAEPYRGRRVRLSGWLKSDAATRGAGLRLRVEDELGRLGEADMATRPVRGEHDWTRFSVVLDVSPQATKILLEAEVIGRGTVWFDDLALDIVGEDVAVTSTKQVSAADLELREQVLAGRRTWSFESLEDRWWHNQLERLVADLEAFVDPKSGLVAGLSPAHGPGVERRLAFAREVEAETVSGAEAAKLWEQAVHSIADPVQCPMYRGLRLRPQLGLLPLGRDEHSGLWEFAHVFSGEPAKYLTANKKVRIKNASGLVLVLIPGGEFTMGAQSEKPDGEHYDPAAQANESPPHALTLAPFFLSKYEMTQAQWLRISGENPSNFEAGTSLGANFHNLLHPVEQVSWIDCERALTRMSLDLPTEAQWEYAARAGSATPWWTGDTVASLKGAANLPDASLASVGIAWQEGAAAAELDDGFAAHAPVDGFAPNPFGLHHVHGNVWEWCRDWLADYSVPARSGDGERAFEGAGGGGKRAAVGAAGARERVIRGGSFNYAPERARSTNRFGASPTLRMNSVGVRPARAIEP